jgi:hypothetical protein
VNTANPEMRAWCTRKRDGYLTNERGRLSENDNFCRLHLAGAADPIAYELCFSLDFPCFSIGLNIQHWNGVAKQ